MSPEKMNPPGFLEERLASQPEGLDLVRFKTAAASALCFIMEGPDAYTVVDGRKVTLGANDLVLTPNGTWHMHGVEGKHSVPTGQN
jgi:hypothetical protein